MNKRYIKVMAVIPSRGVLLPENVESLFMEAARSRAWCHLDVRILTGYSCEMARNEAVRQFLESDADYLWFIDSDIIITPDSLRRLVNLNADVASGVYLRKDDSGIAEVCRVDGTGATVFWTDADLPAEPFSPGGIGLGCALITRHAIEQCGMAVDGRRIFIYQHEPVLVSEDLWFCNLATRIGLQIVVDPSIRLGHIGNKIY